MSSQGNLILLFTLIHFTLGRSFSVLFAIFNQMSILLYFPLALAYDYVQIPVYGMILEHSSKKLFAIRWLTRKTDKVIASINEKPLLKKVMSFGNVGLVLLSALPIRGFGILSASIVSFFLKKGKVERDGPPDARLLLGHFHHHGYCQWSVWGLEGFFSVF